MIINAAHLEGIIVVYDVTDRESFNHVQHWMQEIDKSPTTAPLARCGLVYSFAVSFAPIPNI